MKYLREWSMEVPMFNVVDQIEQVEDWGKSFFWYCFHCGEIYSRMELIPADRSHRNWQAVAGTCSKCSGHRWSIPGSLEGATITQGWEVPRTVLDWQLSRELAFFDSPNHPHKDV